MTLIILPGSLGLLEGVETAVGTLASMHEVELHRYESQPNFERALSAIAEQCSSAPGGAADLLGFSFGGWMAQQVAQRFPERVGKIILAHTFVMEPRYAWRFDLAVRVWQIVPGQLLRKLVKKRARTAFEAAFRGDDARVSGLLAQVDAISRSPDFLGLLLNQQRWMAQSLQSNLAESDPAQPPNGIMIVESDNDPIVGPAERLALKATYPDAKVHCFAGAGHSSALASPKEFAAAVHEFLSDA